MDEMIGSRPISHFKNRIFSQLQHLNFQLTDRSINNSTNTKVRHPDMNAFMCIFSFWKFYPRHSYVVLSWTNKGSKLRGILSQDDTQCFAIQHIIFIIMILQH